MNLFLRFFSPRFSAFSWATFCCALTIGFNGVGAEEPFRFRWIEAPDKARIARPFAARLETQREDGTIVPQQGNVSVSAIVKELDPTLVISELNRSTGDLEFTHVGRQPIDLTGWRLFLYATNATAPLGFDFPAGNICPAGGVFQLQVRAGPTAPGSYPVFKVSPPPQWRNDLIICVVLVDGSGKPADVLPIGEAFSIQELSQVLSASWHGQPLSSRSLYSRTGAINHFSMVDWAAGPVNLGRLNEGLIVPFVTGEHSRSLVPSTMTLSNGVWAGQLTLNDKDTEAEVHLRADDHGGTSGDSAPIKVLPPFAIHLDVPLAFTESELSRFSGNVNIPEPALQDTLIELTSSSPREIEVPARVIISSGSTNTTIDLTSHEDNLLDGSQSVTITARATGFADGSAQIDHYDKQNASLALLPPPELSEAGPAANAMLQVDRPPDRDVRVRLSANLSGRLEFPAEIILPAGQTNLTFEIRARDDGNLNGDQTVTLRTEVVNWMPGVGSLLVRDNETASMQLFVKSPIQEGVTYVDGCTLKLGGRLATNLMVQLAVEPPTALVFPQNPLIVPAMRDLINFAIQCPDNALRDGTRTVHITARANGFATNSTDVKVLDDEAYALQFDSLPLSVISDQPVPVRLRAVDDEGRTLTNRQDTFELSASSGLLVAPPTATFRLTNGVWNGMVTLSGASGLAGR